MRRRAFLGYIAALPFAERLLARPAADDIVYRACDHEIQVLLRRLSGSKVIQRVPCERPGSLVLSSKRDVLFAVNEVGEYEGRPAGSVESFAVDESSRKLERIGRRALSLSSTFPRACALSPDDRFLVVAAYAGGTYSSLPVLADGAIGAVCHVRKEIGRGPDVTKQQCAHPHSVIFIPSGRYVIATDLGADRVNVFGFEGGQLSLIQQLSSPAGSGPGPIQLSKSGVCFAVHHEFSGHVDFFDFDESEGSSPARLRNGEKLSCGEVWA